MKTASVRTALLFALSSAFALGCDDKDGGGAGDSAKNGDTKDTAKSGDADAVAVRTFEKDQRKKGCEMLTPKIVGDVLGVPEPELEQMKIAGCIYSWESADESEVGEASVMSIIVRKDAAQARTLFENATKDQTAEEVRADLAKVMKAAKEREETDTKSKKKAVGVVGGMAGAMVPDAGYTYTDVAGVGDAARASSDDGSITVLLGNMVFNVRAYKGKPAPELDMSGISPTDTKAMVAAAKVADTKWKAKTLEARKAEGAKLAKAVVEAL